MRRLLTLAALSMLVVALSASVALGQSRGPSGADGSFNCEDFDSQASAQAYFEANNPTEDPDGLDGAVGFDSTGTPGVACENLPGPTDLTPAPGYPGGGSTMEEPAVAEEPTPQQPAQPMDGTAAATQYADGVADDNVAALPDTGGPSLQVLALGAGALLVAGGLLLRRRLN